MLGGDGGGGALAGLAGGLAGATPWGAGLNAATGLASGGPSSSDTGDSGTTVTVGGLTIGGGSSNYGMLMAIGGLALALIILAKK